MLALCTCLNFDGGLFVQLTIHNTNSDVIGFEIAVSSTPNDKKIWANAYSLQTEGKFWIGLQDSKICSKG